MEELFQPAHRRELMFFPYSMKLHSELVDPLESRWGCLEQRFPIGSFHIHLEHDSIETGAAGELALQGVEVTSALVCPGRGANAFCMEHRHATLTDRLPQI